MSISGGMSLISLLGTSVLLLLFLFRSRAEWLKVSATLSIVLALGILLTPFFSVRPVFPLDTLSRFAVPSFALIPVNAPVDVDSRGGNADIDPIEIAGFNAVKFSLKFLIASLEVE